jgi:hypothetical protein
VDKDAKDGDVNVVVEVPVGEKWCEIRQQVFGWTTTKLPTTTGSGKLLTLKSKPVITVTGKAFYDAIHGEGDSTRNRRPPHTAVTTKNVTIWEIHPVMQLKVGP